MIPSNKKRPRKLTFAGKLIVSLLVPLAILIASSLYNNVQQRSMQRELAIVRSDADAIKESVNDLKTEVYAIHEHLISDRIDNVPLEYETFNACDLNATFKSWMDYKTITDESSKQYDIQKYADTDRNGIRDTWGRSHIAIANFDIGDMLNIHLSSGAILNTLVADVKQTDCIHPDGSLIEFVVDSSKMNEKIKISGNYNDVFTGSISKIERVGNHFDFIDDSKGELK